MTKHELQNKRSMSIFFRSYKDYFKNLLGLLSIIKESSPKTIIDWIYKKKSGIVSWFLGECFGHLSIVLKVSSIVDHS